MRYLKHYFKVIRRILSSSYPFKRIDLLVSYTKLIFKSIVYHKILSRSVKLNSWIREEKLIGFAIQFYTYPQLVNLFEEIFIFQVYKFATATQNPLIIDCGSNIGLSVLYFKKLYPACQILAFEPDREAFMLLQENVLINNLSRVSVFNVALSDIEDDIILYKKNSSPGALTMSLIESPDKPYKEIISARQLSTYIHDESIDLIKIDVEGSELRIINDLVKSKKIDSIVQMIIEYHPLLTKISVGECMSVISECDFSCHYVKDQLHPGATEVMIYSLKKERIFNRN